MRETLYDCVLRIRRDGDPEGRPAGTGFLAQGVDGRTYALTCAHVVNAALGREKAATGWPEGAVLTAELKERRGVVALDLLDWRPPAVLGKARATDVADIAILAPRPPFTAPPLPTLRVEPPKRVVPPGRRVAFHGFGFMGAPDGVPTEGGLSGVDAGGWFVAEGEESFRRFIEEGLSGAPVFGKDDHVLGMVVQRLELETKQGFVIPALSLARAWPPLAEPYPGLASFDAATAHLFFGRGRPLEADAAPTGKLKELLDRLEHQRLVALLGASGSGKSSLAKAGVAEDYRRRGWTVIAFRPGLDPLRDLAGAIAAAVEGIGPATDKPWRAALDGWEGTLRAGRLREAVAMARGRGAKGVLFIVDQFEEFFTGSDTQTRHDDRPAAERTRIAEQRALILPQLREAVETGAARALLTARLDLVETMVVGDAETARLMADPYPVFVLTAMAAGEVREAVEGPAALFGVRSDPDFATELAIEATRAEGRLPLLQETLRQCWAGITRRDDGWWLRRPAGAGVGDVARLMEESLGDRGDAAMEELGRKFDATDIRRVLLSLVRLADGRPVRRILHLAEVGEGDRAILAALADQRLVMLGGEDRRRTAELVHESLMTRWPSLAGWIDDERAFLEWRDRFEREFALWTAGGEEEKDLLRRHDVDAALAWQQGSSRKHRPPTPDETAFIAASLAFHEREEQRKEEQHRRTRRWLRVALAFGALAMVALVAAMVQYGLAERRAEDALSQESRALAVLSRQESDRGDQGTALLLALEALPEPGFGGQRPVSAEAAAALRQSWLRNRETAMLANDGPVRSAAFSADGRRVVTGSADGMARVWDLRGAASTMTVLEGHKGGVNSAVFGADGRRVLTASADGTARVWDLSGITPTATVLEGHKGFVWSAIFSNDGRQVVTASSDGTARVWDLVGSTTTAIVLEGHTGPVVSASFSNDGRQVVTASGDGTARVWDLVGGNLTAIVLKGHKGPLWSASFSADGHRVVTASHDGTVRLWGLGGDTNKTAILEENRGPVYSASFSADGRRVVTASHDGTVRVWDLSGPAPTATVLRGHNDRVESAKFSADGRRVVTASYDSTVRVWDLSGATPTAAVLELDGDWFSPAAISSDGRRVLVRSQSNMAGVFDLSDPTPTYTILEGHKSWIVSAAFSANGRHVVTASADGNARRWDLSGSPPTVAVLEGHNGKVNDAALSADGRRVLTVSEDGSARGWDLEGAAPKFTVLEGHKGKIKFVASNADGRRAVTLSDDGIASVWDLGAATPTATILEEHKRKVNAAAFNSDGSRLVTASDDGTARVWVLDAATPTATVLEGHKGRVNDAVFSADGRRVVTASDDGTARVWDLGGPAPTFTVLEGHDSMVRIAAFSPDGHRVVTASRDGPVRVWDLRGAIPTAIVLEGHKGWIMSAVFSTDGHKVITASSQKPLRIWNVYPDIAELAALVRSRLTRCLSIAQREQFGLSVTDRSRPRDAIPPPNPDGTCPR